MRAAVDSAHVSSVVKRYGRHRALGGVDLDIQAGRMCALLGANGAGKSTLLGILSTLIRPTSGTVEFRAQGGDTLSGASLRREIGILAHDALLYSQLTAIENLEFYARLYGVDSPKARIGHLLDEVGLDGKARQRPAGTYSRGMTQRLSLARALLHEPTVLLLDEPFTGLDRVGAAALAKSLGAAKERGTVMIVVTHDLESIAGITDHVVILKRGKMVHEEIRGGSQAAFSYPELKEIYHRFSE